MPTVREALDRHLLDDDGRIKLLPAQTWRDVPHELLIRWCYDKGVYGIPTLELVEWLRRKIRDRSAIEIGAGIGDLGFHLGIPQTDSFVQSDGKWDKFYSMIGQSPTKPRADVVRMCAREAVAHYKPDVVIGSWITRRFVPGVDIPQVTLAFPDGVDEEALYDSVDSYIVIGNEAIHGCKTLLERPHQVLHPTWLVSRSAQPTRNCIYLWQKPRGVRVNVGEVGGKFETVEIQGGATLR